jgi:hypothetical protein
MLSVRYCRVSRIIIFVENLFVISASILLLFLMCIARISVCILLWQDGRNSHTREVLLLLFLVLVHLGIGLLLRCVNLSQRCLLCGLSTGMLAGAIVVRGLLKDSFFWTVNWYIMILDNVHIRLIIFTRSWPKWVTSSFLLVRGRSFSWIASRFQGSWRLWQVTNHLYHFRIFYRSLGSFIRALTLLCCALRQRLFPNLLLDLDFLISKLHSPIDTTVRTLWVASSYWWRCTSLPNRGPFGSPLLLKHLHFLLKLLLRLIVIDKTAGCCVHSECRFLLRMINYNLWLLIVQGRYIQGISTNCWIINVMGCPVSSIRGVHGFATDQGFIYWLGSCLLLEQRVRVDVDLGFTLWVI